MSVRLPLKLQRRRKGHDRVVNFTFSTAPQGWVKKIKEIKKRVLMNEQKIVINLVL